MKAIYTHSLLVLGLLPLGHAAEQPRMQPYATDWRYGGQRLASVAFLLDAPAGKDGFIRASNGHLVKPNGERFRVWGMNLTGPANFPSQEDAPAFAAQLAGVGLNCVRFLFIDQPAPAGLLNPKRNDTRAFDAGQLDRLDFFVAELKKRGIYSYISLNVARKYKDGDGVRDYEYLGYAKALTFFDERLIALQKEYARLLLTHHNPYTNSEYRHEPAVAIIELMNENSVLQAWLRGGLLGKNSLENRTAWTDITATYERDLTDRYHAWLRKKGHAPAPRLKPEEFASAPAEQFRMEAAYYMDLEDAYFQMMYNYLRKELGVRPLIVGTTDFSAGASGYPLLRSASRLDLLAGNSYWQHPRYEADPATTPGVRVRFHIQNTPMIGDPLNSLVVRLSRSAVAGKPYVVSEANHPFPSEYACEGIPILAAYGGFHDWDGVMFYNFESRNPSQWDPSIRLWFNMRADPVKMAQIASGALTFLRADVRPALKTVTRTYSPAQVYESLRLPRAESPYFTPGFPRDLPLRHATRIGGFEGPPTGTFSSGAGQPFVSDTKELAWHKRFISVDTARTQALVGFCEAFPAALSHLSASVKNDFAAITLASLDPTPIAKSARLLLTAGARVANSGMKWNDKHTTLEDWGVAPTVIEPVGGAVTLKSLEGAVKVEATPLDGAGRPVGKAVSARKTASGWELAIGDPATVWYLVQVDRGNGPLQ